MVFYLVSKILIDDYIKKNALLKNSSSKRIVNEFEKKKFSNDVYTTFKSKPQMRTLYQLVFKSFMSEEDDILQTVQEISEFIEENITKSLIKPIYMIQICDNCGHSLHVYNNYTEKKSKAKKICPNCKKINDLNNVKQEKDWSYPDGETYMLLEKMSEYDIIKKEMHGLCNKCNIDIKIIETKYNINDVKNEKELREHLSKLYCHRCNELYDVYKLYSINPSKDIIFWKEGYWLEWYVKKICEKSFPTSLVEQGIIINQNNIETEIDVLIKKSGKLYGIECVAINPNKKANTRDVADVLDYNNLVDYSILVISSTLNKKTKKMLEDKEVIIIENSQIEDIGKILKKI
jgi:ssDNA-binding Zn-finger/Zn-ribbon topoisomerase 1